MTATAQTQFAGRSPFAGPKKKAPTKHVNVDALEITDDPMPSVRTKVGESKYHGLFSKRKPGQSLKCKPEDVTKVSHALATWIQRTGLKDHVVRSQRRYEADGMGRVWLISIAPKKLKSV